MSRQIRSRRRAFLQVLLGATFAAIATGTAQAQQRWRIDGTSATWTGSNWSNTGNAPFTSAWVSGSNAVFNANSTVNFATTTVGDVTVADGVTVTVAAGGTLSTTAARTFNVGTGSTLDWQTQGWSAAASSAGFIKTGAGTWNIGAQGNAFNATNFGFQLDAGTVIVGGNNSFGGTNSILRINGGTIQSSGTRAFANSSIIIGGNFTNTGTGNATFSGTVGLGAATRTITNSLTSGSRIYSGVISGASGSGLTFDGTGAGQTYIGNAANTFTGTISINGGEVGFASNGAYGNAGNTIVLDGGRLTASTTAGAAATYTLASTHGIQVGDGAGTAISVVSGGALTYNGVIADKTSETGSWSKQGSGTLLLGGANTYTGATTINNGIVQLTTGNDRLPTGTVVSLGQSASANLGTLDLNGFNQTIAGLNSTSGTNATASNNTVTSATSATLTLGGSGIYSYGNGTDANSGIIAGSISIVKSGTGTQILGDANTYAGTTTVSNGVLNIQNATALGTTAGGTSVATGAALQVQGGITVGDEALTLSGTGVSNTGALRNISGDNTYGGLVTLGSASQINSDSGKLSLSNTGTITGSGFGLTVGGAGDTSISSLIGTGSGGLTKADGGTLSLSGANTYSGGTTISGGTLILGNATNTLADAGAVNVNGGTLSIGTNSDTVGAVTLTSGSITGSSGVLTGSSYDVQSGSVSAILGGTGALSKNSSGTVTLTEANTYSGGTTISDGMLVLGNSTNTLADAGAININGSNAMLSIGANSDTVGAVTLTNGSIAGTSGVLTGTSYNVQSGSVSAILGGSAGLTKSTTGSVVLSGANTYTGGTTVNAGALNVSSSGSLASGSALTLGSSGTADFANVGQTLGAVSNANTATNAINFSANSGTVTLASLSGVGNTHFGSNGTVSGGISSGTVTSAGGLNANISGTANVSAGGLLTGNISAGTVSAASLSSTSVTGGTNNITGAASITTLNGGVTTVGGVATISTLTSGTANLNGATSSVTTLNGGTVNLGTTVLTVNDGTTSGVISGANGSLVKASAGTLTLNAANTYSGGTTVNDGALNVSSTGSLASGSALTVSSSGTANFANADQTLGAVSNTNTLTDALNFSATTGTVTLGSLSGVGSIHFSSNGTVTGGISSGTVTSVGALNADISGTTNVSAGGLLTGNISAGTVSAGSLSSASVTGGINDITGAANITTLNGGATTVNGVASIGTMSSGTANLLGPTSTITTLNGGTVNLTGTALTVSDGTTSGAITGTGSLVKTSTGTLTLSGASSYSGTTNVTAGTLAVNGNNSAAAGAVTVSSGATLAGTGTIGGSTTIAGIHNPGNSPGIQTFSSDLTYSGGASVNWELIGNTTTNTPNPSATFDSIVVGGNLNFAGSTLLNLNFASSGSNVVWADSFWDTSKTGTNGWLVYDVTGSTTNFGGFQLNAFNWTDKNGVALNTARSGASFGLVQAGGGGDIYLNYTISAVPEPSSVLLLSSSVVVFAYLKRRRKRNGSGA